MRQIFIALCAMMMMGINKVAAQVDTTTVMMNTFMAKDPGGNASPANVSMWPNPAKGSVNVYINSIRPGDRGQVVVYNTAGKACTAANLQNGNNKVYLNALQDGIYFLNIKLQNNIVFSKKLMIKN